MDLLAIVCVVVCIAVFVLAFGLLRRGLRTVDTVDTVDGAKPSIFKGDTAKEIGASLLTGALVAGAVALVQIKLGADREDAAAREQFRVTIGVTRHLEGLDPKGSRSLKGMHLSGKVLNRAKLAGEDLRKTNLQAASLRAADLTGADLRGANLFRADLTGATLKKAKLGGADLRFAELERTSFIEVKEPTFGLSRARVNHATCWPEVFLSSGSPAFLELRDGLVEESTVVSGVTRHDSGWGHACRLTLNGISELLGTNLEFETRTIRQIAETFGLPPGRVMSKLAAPVPGGAAFSALPTFVERPCAGSQWLHVNLRDRTEGFSFLLIEHPGQDLVDAEVVRLAPRRQTVESVSRQLQLRLKKAGAKITVDGIAGKETQAALKQFEKGVGSEKEPTVRRFRRWWRDVRRVLQRRFESGDRLKLVGTSTQNNGPLEFQVDRRVPRC